MTKNILKSRKLNLKWLGLVKTEDSGQSTDEEEIWKCRVRRLGKGFESDSGHRGGCTREGSANPLCFHSYRTISLTVAVATLFAVLFSTAVSAAGPAADDKTKTEAVAATQAGANSAEAKVEASLTTMRELVKLRKWSELIEQFKNEDIASWPVGFKDNSLAVIKAAEAANLRGQAYAGMNDGKGSEKDLKLAVELAPGNGLYWFNLADAYMRLKDEPRALAAYGKVNEGTEKSFGWMSISATINAATILSNQGKFQEAFKVMERYDENDIKTMQEAGPVWGKKMIETHEKISAGLGRNGDACLLLAEKGKSDYQIIVPDTYPDPSIGADVKQVARLVQTAFKANGADLPVVAESARDTAKPGIFLGDTAFARNNGITASQLKGWSYIQKVIGRDLLIVGNESLSPAPPTSKEFHFSTVATAKGVTDFLQMYAGTRFLYPDNGAWRQLSAVATVDLLTTPAIEYLPTPRIAVPSDLDVKKTPVMEYDVTFPYVVSFYHLAQNRFPLVDIDHSIHSWCRAIPTDEATFAAHPEYFALLGGKRVMTGEGPQVQYCISNPEVQELLYKDMAKLFKMGYQNVGLGQPDGFRGCGCEPCKQLFGTGPDWGEKVWILHRNLAERAYKDFPNRIVTISVYAITETLPKTFKSFPPNVRLALCGTKESDFRDWKNFGAPQGFGTYLYYWCPNMMPRYFPMRTPLYVENAAKRLMAANVRSISRDGNGGIAYGLEGPTYYTMGRMFDGPGAHTGKELVIEFINASFGKSAPAMMGFYDQLYNSLELYSRYMATREDGWVFQDIYGRGRKHLSNPETIIAFIYPVELIHSLEKQLTLAEKTDTSPKVQTRLTLVRREFDYLKSVVNTVHRYNAYQISPDTASLDRLLNSIDALRAGVDSLFAKDNGLKGWPGPMFPPMGHPANTLKLRDDGYQEPYKNSFLNWDTAAKRQAPMTNAKKLVSVYAKGKVTIDSPLWNNIKSQALSSTHASYPKPLDTQIRAMYDDANLYLLFDSGLSAGATAEAVEKERVEAYLMPTAGSPVTYRFTAGLKPDSRTQAARGLIEDMMNLDYGKFDAMWKGEWSHTAKYDATAGRLTVMMSIPLKSIPPAAAKPDTNWYVNFQRTHAAGTAQGEPYVWSVIPGGTGIEDPHGNGEMSFSGDGSSAGTAKNPAEKWRAEYNAKTREVPPEWKKLPDQLPPLGPWLFRADPVEQGVKDNWCAADATTDDWVPVKVPAFWNETEAVGNYQGFGWYRTRFTLPEAWRGKSLRLMFGSVDEQAWIYVNGKLVREHSEKSEGKTYGVLWEESFTADVPSGSLNFGKDKPNILAVRVNNSTANGGIWRPVMGCAVDKE